MCQRLMLPLVAPPDRLGTPGDGLEDGHAVLASRILVSDHD